MKSHQYKCCDTIIDGIHVWYKGMFEKLGWMILAKSINMAENPAHYKHRIERWKTLVIY